MGKTSSIREVADYLGVSTRTVRRYIERGALAAINVGLGTGRPRYRISENSLQSFLAKRRVR